MLNINNALAVSAIWDMSTNEKFTTKKARLAYNSEVMTEIFPIKASCASFP